MFSIYLVNPVSAEEEQEQNMACCEKTKAGESCRYTFADNCDPSFNKGEFQACDQSTFCKPGCCISPEGTCSKQVGKAVCEALGDGWVWNPDSQCSLEKCQKGCCVLGESECKLTTEKRCASITSQFEGLEKDFRAIGSEAECLNICKKSDKGCCVKNDGTCVWASRGSCGMEDGIGDTGFYKDTYCSNDILQKICAPKCTPESRMGCIEGEEDVFWFDSCGNPEGVAEDCDYAQGTLCSEKDKSHETAYCKSLACTETIKYDNIDYSGVSRMNGESWCVYDSKVGSGADTVGSRQWRHICINGVETVEPCKDFREEYCIQADADNYDGKVYREAKCNLNRADDCVNKCNTANEIEEDSMEKRAATRADRKCCSDPAKNCNWLWSDEEEKYGLCVPTVPEGMRFWEPDAKEICNTQNQECKTIWESSVNTGWDWECIGNSKCYGEDTLKTWNQLCNLASDCGAKCNYLGTWDNGGITRDWDAGSGDDTDLTRNALHTLNNGQCEMNPEDGIYAGRVDLKTMAESFGTEQYLWAGAAAIGAGAGVGLGIGVMGGLQGVLNWIGAAGAVVSIAFAIKYFAEGDIGSALLVLGSATGGLALGGTLGVLGVMPTIFGGLAVLSPGGLIIAAAIAIPLLLMSFIADSEERTVRVACEPWQPPVGGSDCDKCDKDMVHPCSEYRCKSLGQMCEFIKENEGSGRKTCYWANLNDVAKPIISPAGEDNGAHPLVVMIKDGGERKNDYASYSLNKLPSDTKIHGGYAITGDIPAYSKIIFGIQTDKPSQCKFSTTFDPQSSFSKMTNYFPDIYYTTEHNMSISALSQNTTYDFYIICRGKNGQPTESQVSPPYKITFKTNSGPDLMPPEIIGAIPKNEGFIASDNTLTDLTIMVDEATWFRCKWSKQDQDYWLMENNLTCGRSPQNSRYSEYGECTTKFETVEGQNKLYIRCIDHQTPDPEQRLPEMNSNEDAYVYTVTKTKPLKITSLSPPAGTEYFTRNVTIQAITEEGAENGKAICSFQEPDKNWGDYFFITNSTYHEHTLSGLLKDKYSLEISCYDAAKNSVIGYTNFTVTADMAAPNVVALYKDSSNLHIILDEPASCEYAGTTFSYGSGKSASTESTTATIPTSDDEAHIICMDTYGNMMPEIIVKTEISII